MASRMPWLARQPRKATGPVVAPCGLAPWFAPGLGLVPSTDVQTAGVVLTGCPAALTGPLDRSQAPGWPGMLRANSVKIVPPAPVSDGRAAPSEVTGRTVRSGGARLGRTHSGMATWRAAKTARVTAMAGTVRRISAPAATPRAKANAA